MIRYCSWQCMVSDPVKSSTAMFNQIKALAQLAARIRDFNLPCICCGRKSCNSWHGGHLFPAETYRGVALDLRNIHKQTNFCNTTLHGNPKAFKAGFIARYGLSEFNTLEEDAIKTKNRQYNPMEIQSIKESIVTKIQEFEHIRNEFTKSTYKLPFE